MLSHNIAINFKSHLDLNKKDSPPCPSKTKSSQHAFQANGVCQISSCQQVIAVLSKKDV